MKISVIVPSYKPGKYIYQCLDSLCNQTLSANEYEVLLVLNGCCEPWKTSLEEYIFQHGFTNIRLFQTDIAGVSNARNYALDRVHGEFISFVDDDDYVSTNYLEELLRIAVTGVTPVSNVISFIDGTKQIVTDYLSIRYNKIKNCDTVSLIKAKSFFSVPVAKVLAKGTIGSCRFNANFKNGEDSLFMFLISKRIKHVKATNENIVYYRRIRKNSATQTKKKPIWLFKNSVCLMNAITKTYICNPLHYNFLFFISRILGILYSYAKMILKTM